PFLRRFQNQLMSAFYTKEEILNQLDNCTRDFTFPMLDNGYVYLGDTRLSAYRDERHWALIIEVLGYNVRAGNHDGLSDCLHCFGNCLKRPPGTANEDFLYVTSDGIESPTFDDVYGWYIRNEAKSIRIRQSTARLTLNAEQLKEKGIELVEAPQITGADLMRSLLPEYREQLLATEEELRERIPEDLPLILRLDEWNHPDLAADQLPSESKTFRMIADVLITGDASLYQPTEEPNTHWKNWLEGGTL
ncbi:MAG TPA: hypothetical protein VNB22_04430, partial [Pyrinomonadaceae bacterium]|nr:hypothetical protein [Pyrinomonadaceae bacterium]